MGIVSGDLVIRYSGGASNADPNASLGGAMSSNGPTDNTQNNLFDDVTGSESLPGDIEYRCEYLLNNHGTLTAKSARVYISADTSSYIDIALDGNGLNATAEGPKVDESTAPSGETFSHPTTYSAGLDMTNIPAGQKYAIWIRRTIPAAASAATPYSFTLKYDCDTDA